MDEHAKGEVRKHDSWLEDTRHLLEIIQEENKRGPQPPGIIPVTLDISSMYTNVPLEEGLTLSDMALAGCAPAWGGATLARMLDFLS